MQKIISLVLVGLLSLSQLMAQSAVGEGNDFIRQTGKIYVVVAIIAIVLLGLLLLLVRLDRRLTNVENQIFSKKNGRS